MKKVFLILSILFLTSYAYSEEVPDSIKQIKLEEIVVSSIRAGSYTPTAYSNLSAADIKKENAAKNIPFVLQMLPSVVAFSEDGSGVGNTSLRIRGTDATRINVTLNGMPLNNPESQEVYWVNLPDLSNSLQSMQLQRGIGSSTNGSAAFGASLSLKTGAAKQNPYGEASTSVGSYNTFLSSIAVGTGILKNGLSFDARYSRVTGDGYIRNGSVDHKNLYAALSHYTDKQLIRLIYMNGIQHTGITWEGISPEQMKKDRRYNPAGEYYDDAGNIHYYDNETDNYYSNIIQLVYSRELNPNLVFNANLNYNNGYGYYENYKMDQKFSKFGLPEQIIDGVTYKKSDIVRRKLMRNDFYVGNMSLNYSTNNLNIIGGVLLSQFDGDHYGKLRWIKRNENIGDNYEWYRNDAKKREFSSFAKIEYKLIENLSVFGDIQYRYVDYRMDGIDDDLSDITNKKHYSFFNPKGGLFYSLNSNNSLYASVGVSRREPLRTDIKESVKGGSNSRINEERMIDYELGYKFASSKASFGINLYYMDYKDQMVQTGKLNDVGYKLMENVPNSYRMGLELQGAVEPAPWVRIDANMTLSRNKIKNYTAYYDVYNDDYDLVGQIEKHLKKTDISFSPTIVGAAALTFIPYKNLNISLSGKLVGKQYYDNTSNPDNQLPSYFITNFVAGYTFDALKLGHIDVQFYVNNLLNKRYVANAWVDTSYSEDGTPSVYKGYYPQATRNIMGKVTIRF